MAEKKAGSLRVMEFYSGIGGMRYSLSKSGANAQVIQAFDINNIANDVYQHNFLHRPSQSNIETLRCSDLDRYTADVWLLSPPCQPYTRQGNCKHSSDSRSSSFLHLLHLLHQIQHPPLLFFLENVVGFEISDTHRLMMQILLKKDFSVEEFILSPSNFGVPYSRPRYFCLARRIPRISPSPPPFSDANLNMMEDLCDPVKNYLEVGGEKHRVPMKVVERWGAAMDIVYPESKRCCCFTRSYRRYVKGTGSVLCEEEEEEEEEEEGGGGGKDCSLRKSRTRYFSPREVANLHSFPADFEFPEHVSLKQRYALLGNSLSIAVVSPLLTHLFSYPPLPAI